MGLLTIIRKTKLKEKQIRVLILGLDNAGKTTIVKRILNEDINEISPTLGFNIRTIIHAGFSLNVWDIGGQKSLRPYWRNYFEITDAVIWVVDSSDRERIIDCRDELKGLLLEEKLAGANLLILANKQDIAGSLTPQEIASALQLDLLTSHTYTVQACSARQLDSSQAVGDGKGDERIWKGLDWVVKEVSRRVYYGSGEKSFGSNWSAGKSELEAVSST